jgi:transcriptional regulator with XRE-family HTH domain
MEKKLLLAFGRRLRAERERMGLSQEDFAEAACLHRTYIGGVERGERNLSLVNIARIARALKLSPAELLRGIEVKKS